MAIWYRCCVYKLAQFDSCLYKSTLYSTDQSISGSPISTNWSPFYAIHSQSISPSSSQIPIQTIVSELNKLVWSAVDGAVWGSISQECLKRVSPCYYSIGTSTLLMDLIGKHLEWNQVEGAGGKNLWWLSGRKCHTTVWYRHGAPLSIWNATQFNQPIIQLNGTIQKQKIKTCIF